MRTWIALLLLALAWPAADVAFGQIQRQNKNLTIFFTGDVQGEINSCGCPKEDLGGATRRASFLDTLKWAGWEFLTLDAGGIVPFGPRNPQKDLKAEHLARAMGRLGIDGMALGDHDLAQGPEYVAQLLEWLGQPVIATNVHFPDPDAFPSVRHRVYQVREPRVGVLAFLDPGLTGEDHAWLTVTPWEEHRDLVDSLRAEVDVLVAMACVADSSRLNDLAELYPQLDFVIGSHRGEIPATLWHVGNTALVGCGSQGKYLGRAEVKFTPERTIEWVKSVFLPVREGWGHRERIDEIALAYNHKVRALLAGPEEAGGDEANPD